MQIIKYLFFGIWLCSCTLLNIAPRPEPGNIKYIHGRILEGKNLNLIVHDDRRKKEHSQELMTVFQNILEKQIVSQGGKVTPEGQDFHFTLRTYDIANSSTGCTVIISYNLSYLKKNKKSVVTEDHFPCVDAKSKKRLASSTISKMLKETSVWLEVTMNAN